MKYIPLGASGLQVPAVAIGCMRLQNLDKVQADTFIRFCIDNEANFFDHADIYGRGVCEEIFGQVLAGDPSLREKVFLQTKCGIISGKMYDASRAHIIKSVEDSLSRLHTDHLDMLAMHRPDALMEPEETAEAFTQLQISGKVLHFGVSNHNPMQMALLQKYMKQKITVDQLQFSVPVSGMVSQGMEVNMTSDGAYDRDGGVLDYCRLHDITIQAWSPFQAPNWGGPFLGNEKYAALNAVLSALGQQYAVTPAAVAAAWILRHPAKMQLLSGTMNTAHLSDILKACAITLSREEWYRIYLSAGHILP